MRSRPFRLQSLSVAALMYVASAMRGSPDRPVLPNGHAARTRGSDQPPLCGTGTEDLGGACQKLARSLNKAWGAIMVVPIMAAMTACIRIALAAAQEFIDVADPQSGAMFNRFLNVLIAALSD
jgi:hypothetical protein